jgi:hypothetical protein
MSFSTIFNILMQPTNHTIFWVLFTLLICTGFGACFEYFYNQKHKIIYADGKRVYSN